ncbi:MAG TPA: S41 family peptidase, partial [Gemmatimonadaceae bacterium]|nr:S41 family peptidase [Gemmatimonadaceae bacterium]
DGKSFERTLVAIPKKGTISKFGNLPPIAGVVTVDRRLVGGAHCNAGVVGFNIWLPILAPELERAVKNLADCDGIVIDLRGNPGGVGAMVMGFGGFFVPSTVSLGTMRTRDLTLNFAINPRQVGAGPYSGPVAILVDAMSASTSEIFATGMQRIGRARVFGQRSAAAALPALMNGLPSGDVFVHAVADFTDPRGGRIEGAGVVPDEIVPLTEADLSKNIDAPLEAAVKWIQSLRHSS